MHTYPAEEARSRTSSIASTGEYRACGASVSVASPCHRRDIALPICARGRQSSVAVSTDGGAGMGAPPPPGEPNTSELIATLLEDETKRQPPAPPVEAVQPTSSGKAPAKADTRTPNEPVRTSVPQPRSVDAPPPSQMALAARKLLLMRAGLSHDSEGGTSPGQVETVAGGRLAAEGEATVRRRGKWCFGTSGALTAVMRLGHHLWRANRLKEAMNVLCDLNFVEAMHCIGAGAELLDMLRNLQAASLASCRVSIWQCACSFAGSNFPLLQSLISQELLDSAMNQTLLSVHDPTLGLSAAQRASLQRLERISTMMAFLQANVSDLTASPSLVFQLATNQPKSSMLTRDAESLWDLNWENRHYFQLSNKAERRDPCLMEFSLKAEHRAGRDTNDGPPAAAINPDADGCFAATRCQFSPDGKLVAVGHANGNLSLWDVVTGRLKKEFIQPTPPVKELSDGVDMHAMRRKLKRQESGLNPVELPPPPTSTAVAFKADDRYVCFGLEYCVPCC